MNKDLQSILDFIQQSAHLNDEEKKRHSKSLKDADKELEITSFKLDRTEKVKRTTAILLEETIEELEQKRKAVEAQNHELEIESSLERVRTVAMSMNEPDDMLHVCRTIAEQLELLKIKEIRNVQTAIFYKENGTYMNYEYYAKHHKTFITDTTYTNHKIHEEFADKMLKGNGEFMIAHIKGNELKAWIEYQKTTNVFIDDYLYTASSLNYYWFSLGPVALGISTYVPLTAEEINLFKRFLKVFELSYRRYLDIELAIKQAKEARIETALERVRAVATAMRKPDDLLDVCKILFEEFHSLGFSELRNSMINIYNDDNGYLFNYDYSESAGKTITHFTYNAHATIDNLVKNTRGANDAFIEYAYTGKELDEWRAFRKKSGEADDARLNNAEAIYYYFYSIGTGSIGISTFSTIGEEKLEVLKRFRNVFSLSYQRYTDLALAEAQAKEARIETALERIRARTMAMQKSDELSETVFILFQQFKQLGETPDQATIGIINEDEWVIEYWVTMYGNQTNRVYKFPIDEPNVTNRIYKAWKEQKKSLVIELSGNELYDFAHFRESMGGAAYNPEEKKRVINVAFFSKGIINVQSNESRSEESIRLLERFAAVFEQTYTRFLDLEKAEAQAREAQIEAALERVRSRSMGMQKSEELKEVIQLVYEQFVHLNIKIEHTGFVIDYKARDDYNIWVADPLGVPSQLIIPYFDSVYYNRFNEAKEKGEDFFATSLSFDEKNKFYQKLFEYVPGLTEEAKEFYFNCSGLAASTVLLDNISLYIENFSGTPYTDEENKTLMRFGKVFQQTYTRFNDLKKAEAQAVEAIKRASVDRVRAEIASMRTTNDLERITPLIWNELTVLGIPFVRCGVFIMDEEQQQVQTFLYTEGKTIASFTSTFSNSKIIAEALPYWRRKEIYKTHWDEAAFLEQAKSLVEQGAILTGENYLTEHHPTNLYLHFLPFLQGMLYVGDAAALSEEHLQLVQALADAFSTAYARYEDFNKLEAAKQQVDKTLADLKQTQTQLIQSEKMASLGELTAGIAHEIQNPLNFVNNFSEVSNELIVELHQERNKEQGARDEELENEILNDIARNLEKINHHGKRADAIVKGMLQHSRSSTGVKEPTGMNALADEYLRLAFHGLRAKEKSFNAVLKTDFDESIGKINIIPQDIGRVLLNLYNNAFYAVSERRKLLAVSYEPLVSVSTKKSENQITITVSDNGNGIPQKVVDKIFQPFFTTKPTGQGTGLGLSLSYDIIKAHGGEIKVETKEGEGTTFTIQLQANA